MLASKADLEALLKLLKTKLEEAKRVSWEVPYGLSAHSVRFVSYKVGPIYNHHPTPTGREEAGHLPGGA